MKRIFYFIDKKGRKEIQFNTNDYTMRIHWIHEQKYSPWYEINNQNNLLLGVTHVYYKSEYELLIFSYGESACVKCIALASVSKNKKKWCKLPLHIFQMWNAYFVTEDDSGNYIMREPYIITTFDKEFQFISSCPVSKPIAKKDNTDFL